MRYETRNKINIVDLETYIKLKAIAISAERLIGDNVNSLEILARSQAKIEDIWHHNLVLWLLNLVTKEEG